VIGGRVLDLSGTLAFGRQSSIYASALVWTAVEEDIVLLVPATAVSLAWAQLAPADHPVLEVLLGLPVVVVDELTSARSREIGALLQGRDTRLDLAHAAVCALERDWPVVTAEPTAYADLAARPVLEPLP
jgi:hypothetical protein